MKKEWFAVKIENNDPYSIVHYQNSLITRVWIIENEIAFMVNNEVDSFGKNTQKGAWGNVTYKLTIPEFNKLKAHLEELVGITKENNET